ncbi:glyoxalase [Clostridium botulinum]|uniref:VOC family protein n=1 Tax=unclassified Clostridium TaxID=2614128 RepID=UPI0013C7F5AF|nr:MULTISPECIES: VOC family protein [unclassified Clostridium]MBY7007398.1 VOC family protein [Clostridium botulinum]NFH71749.1 glyoxalase [Clostridium botulinum]NFI00711.1 glyoxalase [Clostridium botulinum]NFI62455.1 glyoxalase [Clostridium botulinum]NFI80492.1 glyoxalase [Clostridium botulinum]
MLGMAHIGIPTKNIEETKAFYNSLGFKILLETFNEEAKEKVAFLQLKDIVLETYETMNAAEETGALDHIAISVNNIEEVFTEIKNGGYCLLHENIQYLPFWENGVKFFMIKGPSEEKIEFCQKL